MFFSTQPHTQGDIMIYVLYHGGCNDGMASATVAYYKFGKNATYKAVQYNQPLKLDIATLNKSDEVYVLDFSYPAEILDKINEKVGKLIVLDHHKTAAETLKGKPYAAFDMEKSGAGMTWDYFYTNTPRPTLINLVEDRDLWLFKHEDTVPLSEYIKAAGIMGNFSEWLRLLLDEDHILKCIDIGRNTLLRFKQIKLTRFLESNKYVNKRIDEHNVALYNAVDDISDTADILYRNLPIDYVISYFFTTTGDLSLSFRSGASSDVDVSLIAKSYGGGGHRNASGAMIASPVSFNTLKQLYSYPDVNIKK